MRKFGAPQWSDSVGKYRVPEREPEPVQVPLSNQQMYKRPENLRSNSSQYQQPQRQPSYVPAHAPAPAPRPARNPLDYGLQHNLPQLFQQRQPSPHIGSQMSNGSSYVNRDRDRHYAALANDSQPYEHEVPIQEHNYAPSHSHHANSNGSRSVYSHHSQHSHHSQRNVPTVPPIPSHRSHRSHRSDNHSDHQWQPQQPLQAPPSPPSVPYQQSPNHPFPRKKPRSVRNEAPLRFDFAPQNNVQNVQRVPEALFDVGQSVMIRGELATILHCERESRQYAVKFHKDGRQNLVAEKLLSKLSHVRAEVPEKVQRNSARKPPRVQRALYDYEDEEEDKGDEEFYGPNTANSAEMDIPAHARHDRDTPPPMVMDLPHMRDRDRKRDKRHMVPPQWGHNKADQGQSSFSDLY